MNPPTRQSLQDLAAALKLLEQCEKRVRRVPGRFRELYLDVPFGFSGAIQSARFGIEELAQRLIVAQQLPSYWADLSRFTK